MYTGNYKARNFYPYKRKKYENKGRNVYYKKRGDNYGISSHFYNKNIGKGGYSYSSRNNPYEKTNKSININLPPFHRPSPKWGGKSKGEGRRDFSSLIICKKEMAIIQNPFFRSSRGVSFLIVSNFQIKSATILFKDHIQKHKIKIRNLETSSPEAKAI